MKNRTLFDHLDEIYTTQRLDYWETLTDADRRTYSQFMVNRFISMGSFEQVELVNEFQQFYSHISPREHYLFYSQIIPGGRKQFNRYVKPKKETAYEDWLVGLVGDHFGVSRGEAETYLDLYSATADGKMALKTLLDAYGTDPKLIRKLTLT